MIIIDDLYFGTRRKQLILTAAHVFFRASSSSYWTTSWHPAADLRYQRHQGQEGRSWKYVCEDVCIAERKTHQVAAGSRTSFLGCPRDPRGSQGSTRHIFSHGYLYGLYGQGISILMACLKNLPGRSRKIQEENKDG